MLRKHFLFISFIIIGMILSACQLNATPTNEVPTPIPVTNLTQEQIITIGIVSDDPAGTIEGYQPLMDYMARQLNDLGIKQGNVVVTPDLDTMVEKLKSGEVDLYYESSYGALYTYENAGAIPLLRGWRNGVGEYHSVIYVRKDSGITSINGLQGKLIAFSEPKSTTGYFLPKVYLMSSGLILSEQSTTTLIPAGQVGYLFTNNAENNINSVLLGKVVGGAEESKVYDDLTQEQKDQVVILARTQDIPRSLMMASSLMNSSLRQRVVSILKEAGNTEEGKAVLKGAKKTTQFDELPLGPQATMEFLQGLFKLIK